MQRRSRAALTLIILLTALAAGAWALRDPAPPSSGIATPEEFARRLGLHGADVRPAPTGEACTDPFVRVPGRRYEFGPPEGEAIERLCLYPYEDPDAAAAVARAVPKKADLPALCGPPFATAEGWGPDR